MASTTKRTADMATLAGGRKVEEIAAAAEISKTQARLALRRGVLPEHSLLRKSLAAALGTDVAGLEAAAARTRTQGA